MLAAVLGFSLAGCHRDHDHSHKDGDDHHHEDKTAQITVWSAIAEDVLSSINKHLAQEAIARLRDS